ncbi:hypothetical protein [Burkholderia vietnamiensis]|uniref:hypothetical protein n=1 Tax=Burkholderia vietnamiensis TaxID=60552 RepID=UPI001ABB0ED8|nr:hypothetical protein [Burkholderia vietnamiensis]
MMKRILAGASALLLSTSALCATMLPSTMINWISVPTWPSASAGTVFATPAAASGAPSFRALVVSDMPAANANTVLANVTAASAKMTAFAMPSCSGSANALQYASGTGFTCASNYALLSSPAFNGVPTAPTASAGTSTTQIATTAFVQNAVAGGGNAGSFTTITASGLITPSQTAGIAGTNTNNNANAGSIGEYLNNSTTGTSLTSGAAANATSVPLSAGDWDAQCVATFVPAAGTTPSTVSVGINTTAATLPAVNTGGFALLASTFPAGAAQALTSPTIRIGPLSSPSTAYCVVQATYSGGTMTVNGFIRARRPR